MQVKKELSGSNVWLSEVQPDEIKRKIKVEENTEEPKIKLQNRCDQQRLQDEDDIELKSIENLLNSLQDQRLTNDEIRLVGEVAEWKKT